MYTCCKKTPVEMECFQLQTGICIKNDNLGEKLKTRIEISLSMCSQEKKCKNMKTANCNFSGICHNLHKDKTGLCTSTLICCGHLKDSVLRSSSIVVAATFINLMCDKPFYLDYLIMFPVTCWRTSLL